MIAAVVAAKYGLHLKRLPAESDQHRQKVERGLGTGEEESIGFRGRIDQSQRLNGIQNALKQAAGDDRRNERGEDRRQRFHKRSQQVFQPALFLWQIAIEIFFDAFLPLEIAGLADRFIDVVDLVADDHLILIVAPLGTKHGWQLIDRFSLYLVFIFDGEAQACNTMRDEGNILLPSDMAEYFGS